MMLDPSFLGIAASHVLYATLTDVAQSWDGAPLCKECNSPNDHLFPCDDEEKCTDCCEDCGDGELGINTEEV